MDVRQLLLLAVDNSNIAKKKAARLDRDDDEDEPAVSNDAVAAYLAKQKKFKAKLKAQEENSKRKRVEARLNASLTTRKEKKQQEVEDAEQGRFLPGDIRNEKAKLAREKELKQQKKEKEQREKERVLKEKIRKKQEEKKRIEEEERKSRKRKSTPPQNTPTKKKGTDKERIKELMKTYGGRPKEKDDSHDNMHRKEKKYRGKEVFESSITYGLKYSSNGDEKEIITKTKEKEKAKEKPKKKVSNGASSSSLSFTDLMKLAKTNASTSQLEDDGTLVKKKERTKTFDEEYGNPGRKSEKNKVDREERSSHKSKYRDEDDEPRSKQKTVNDKSRSDYKDESRSDYKDKSISDYKEKKSGKLQNGHTEKHVLNHKSEKEIRKAHENKCNNNTKETDKIDKRREFEKNERRKMNKIEGSSSSSRGNSSSHSSKHTGNEHRNENSKHKYDVYEKNSKLKESTKENKCSPPPVKRGLIAQTISTKKSGSIQPPGKITSTFKQVKPGKRSGIEAQCMTGGGLAKHEKAKMKTKKPVRKHNDDLDDALDKEMRMLAKKRRLFEQTGTATVNSDEENNYYDSEEDYDLSEDDDDYDDDFIDDTEAAPDVSKAIRKITGYDKRIYDDSDEDVNNMESNYSQIQKEEARSARIAKEEDRIEALKEAEDEARENAKRKQKEMNLKKNR